MFVNTIGLTSLPVTSILDFIYAGFLRLFRILDNAMADCGAGDLHHQGSARVVQGRFEPRVYVSMISNLINVKPTKGSATKK
jgi:hypothetical protein